jgi:hypothetical protein
VTARPGLRDPRRARAARPGVRLGVTCAALLFAAACGVRPTGVITAGEPAVAGQAVPQTTVYLARRGRLVPVRRVAFPGAPQAALNALWEQGAKAPEKAQGLWSPMSDLGVFYAIFNRGALPPGVLMASFYADRPVSDLLRAQIVCSGTAQPGVERVQLADPADPVLRRPMRCSSFRRHLAD